LPKSVVDMSGTLCFLLYYESINRELQTRPINECRSDERLKTKVEEPTCLTCTGLNGELENLKIKTRLILIFADCCLL
jgi:hypothetical protein